MANYAYTKDIQFTISLRKLGDGDIDDQWVKIQELGEAFLQYVVAVQRSDPHWSLLEYPEYNKFSPADGGLPMVKISGSEALGRWSYKSNLENYFGDMKTVWSWLNTSYENFPTNKLLDENNCPEGYVEYLHLMDLLNAYDGFFEVEYYEIDEGADFCQYVKGKYLPVEGFCDFEYQDRIPSVSEAMECWGAADEDEANELIQSYCDRLKGKDDDDDDA